jgi:LytS/YehU family sensor histidine kinase
MVPSLTIQPLVENAIRHGLDGRPGGGTVWITARLEETALRVTVADDGLGPQPSRHGTGLGLGALEQRMRLACPGATVSTDAPAVGGFVVHVTLPV